MSKMSLLFSAAFSVAALSMPVMAHAQRVQTICNDGTVMRTADANACRGHRGVRSVTNNRRADDRRLNDNRGNDNRADDRRPDDRRMDDRRMIPPRGNDVERGGVTTAQMMAELHIDHTRNNATAKCSDGFYYHGAHVRSACSRDGGVSNWYK